MRLTYIIRETVTHEIIAESEEEAWQMLEDGKTLEVESDCELLGTEMVYEE
jgi:hypothetical protein